MRQVTFSLLLAASIATGSAIGSANATAYADQKLAEARELKVDQIFSQWDHPDSPGCLAFAFQDGKVILNKGYGMADLEWGQPIDEDTVFYLASTSKQFTAASIALLILDGRLSLETDVRDFIPELPDFGHTIRVKHLLYHTSGLRDYLGLKYLMGDMSTMLSNQDVVDLLSRQRDLNFEPGSSWSYSNSGYALLSVLVERVTGMTLAEFGRQRLFEPLGMSHTHWDDDYRKVVARRARSYEKGPDGNWLRQPKLIDVTGDGNLLSTSGDLLLWDENFYQPKVGGQALLEMILHGGADVPMGANLKYAFGLMVGDSYRGLPVVHHGGNFLGFRIELLRFTEQHFSSGLLCNAGDANSTELSHRIADVYLEDLLAPVEVPDAPDAAAVAPLPEEAVYALPAATLESYAGTYQSPEIDLQAVITLDEGELQYTAPGIFHGAMVPVAADEFKVVVTYAPGVNAPFQVRVVRADDGSISGLVLDLMSFKNFRLNRVAN